MGIGDNGKHCWLEKKPRSIYFLASKNHFCTFGFGILNEFQHSINHKKSSFLDPKKKIVDKCLSNNACTILDIAGFLKEPFWNISASYNSFFSNLKFRL